MSSVGNIVKCLVHLSFVVLFVFCAYVQLNDPDKEVWIAVYSAPALVALINVLRLSILRKFPPFSNMTYVTLGYALYMAYQILPYVLEAYSKDQDIWKLLLGDNPQFSMQKNDLALEEARELGGLCIIIFYCFLSLFLSPDVSKEHEN